MIRRAALALALALAALPVTGSETIVAGLSQSRVSMRPKARRWTC
jgi:hypothetical protein